MKLNFSMSELIHSDTAFKYNINNMKNNNISTGKTKINQISKNKNKKKASLLILSAVTGHILYGKNLKKSVLIRQLILNI